MEKTNDSRLLLCNIKNIWAFLILLIFTASCSSGWEISNPYNQIDWENHQQYKANFHTHTTRSDGWLNPHTVVDNYHGLGYTILAITDHNEVTYPWTSFSQLEPSQTSLRRMVEEADRMPENLMYEDRNPASLGMIAIQANELSSHDHMGSFFNDHKRRAGEWQDDDTDREVVSIEAVREKGGIVMIYHPGRYDRSTDWYVELYKTYDHLFGMEIYNRDRYPNDRMLWDSILSITMPERPVWGYSNDDTHLESHIGRNWNVLILPELSHESVRKGMEQGLSYYVYAPEGHQGPPPPAIDTIYVNNKKRTIDIIASGYERIVWIAEGETVHEGNRVTLTELSRDFAYIRAELHGKGNSIVGTQPFGIRTNR